MRVVSSFCCITWALGIAAASADDGGAVSGTASFGGRRLATACVLDAGGVAGAVGGGALFFAWVVELRAGFFGLALAAGAAGAGSTAGADGSSGASVSGNSSGRTTATVGASVFGGRLVFFFSQPTSNTSGSQRINPTNLRVDIIQSVSVFRPCEGWCRSIRVLNP